MSDNIRTDSFGRYLTSNIGIDFIKMKFERRQCVDDEISLAHAEAIYHLVLIHLFVKVPRIRDSEETFLVLESTTCLTTQK